MERNIAAIINISSREFRRQRHRQQNLLCHGPRHRSHRRDKCCRSVRCDGRRHSSRNHARRKLALSRRSLPQKFQLSAKFIKNSNESRRRCTIRRFDFAFVAKSLCNNVDRAVLQVQSPPVGKHPDLRSPLQPLLISRAVPGPWAMDYPDATPVCAAHPHRDGSR